MSSSLKKQNKPMGSARKSEAGSRRRQIIMIDSAFPIKSGPRFGSRIRQVEKVDSEQGFRFQNFDFSELDNLSKVICLLLAYWMKSFPLKIIKLERTCLRVKE